MEEIITTYTNRIQKKHPALTEEQARKIAEQFYSLAKLTITGFKSSNYPLITDNSTKYGIIIAKDIK